MLYILVFFFLVVHSNGNLTLSASWFIQTHNQKLSA